MQVALLSWWSRVIRGTLCALSLIVLLAGQGSANSPAESCDHAARQIAAETGVPLDILRAITRTETGRGGEMRPWPWTVNMQGTGVWFDSEVQAQIYVFRHFRAGARSFDVGCFQINYKWHARAFNSIEDMFDPILNARYAARYLKELFAEHGNWNDAIGAYHSRTHRYAQRYLNRVAEVQRNLPDGDAVPAASDRRGAPLVFGQSVQHTGGSLVPLTVGVGGRLIDDATGG